MIDVVKKEVVIFMSVGVNVKFPEEIIPEYCVLRQLFSMYFFQRLGEGIFFVKSVTLFTGVF